MTVIKKLVKRKENIPAMYQRAMIYFPYIVSILRKNNVPDDFKYLAVIESNIQNVVNPMGASGVWQIMPGASKDMGLKVDKPNNIDERNDLIKSTIAVSKYLNWLYKQLGSWTLVAAAYNGGIGMIKRKIKTTGQGNFYLMPLNHETADYVLKISAVKELFENHLNLEQQVFKTSIKNGEKENDPIKTKVTIPQNFNSIKITHN